MIMHQFSALTSMYVKRAVSTAIKLLIRDGKNNGRAAFNEKASNNHHNDEDNVNVSTKLLVMRKIMQVHDFKCFLRGKSSHKKYQY